MQHHAADQLDVEVALTERAATGLPHERKGLREQVVDRLTIPGALAKGVGLGLELVILEELHLGLDPIDRLDPSLIFLELLRLAHPQGAVDQSSGHWRTRLAGATAGPATPSCPAIAASPCGSSAAFGACRGASSPAGGCPRRARGSSAACPARPPLRAA